MEQVYLYFGIVAFWLCAIAATGFALYGLGLMTVVLWEGFSGISYYSFYLKRKRIPTEWLRDKWRYQRIVNHKQNKLFMLRYRWRNINDEKRSRAFNEKKREEFDY